MNLIIAILLILLLLGALGSAPVWPHAAEWGYYPSGGIVTVLVVLLILWLLGVFR